MAPDRPVTGAEYEDSHALLVNMKVSPSDRQKCLSKSGGRGPQRERRSPGHRYSLLEFWLAPNRRAEEPEKAKVHLLESGLRKTEPQTLLIYPRRQESWEENLPPLIQEINILPVPLSL